MGNRVISYSLRGFEVFLKVPMIIIMRFGENNVLANMEGFAKALHGLPYICCLLFIKTEKVQEHDLY